METGERGANKVVKQITELEIRINVSRKAWLKVIYKFKINLFKIDSNKTTIYLRLTQTKQPITELEIRINISRKPWFKVIYKFKINLF